MSPTEGEVEGTPAEPAEDMVPDPEETVATEEVAVTEPTEEATPTEPAEEMGDESPPQESPPQEEIPSEEPRTEASLPVPPPKPSSVGAPAPPLESSAGEEQIVDGVRQISIPEGHNVAELEDGTVIEILENGVKLQKIRTVSSSRNIQMAPLFKFNQMG